MAVRNGKANGGNGRTNGTVTVAAQTFKTEKDCRHVVKFEPDGKATVGDRTIDELSSNVYIDKRVLDALGNPERISVTVSAA